jgi:hypothetical protein
MPPQKSSYSNKEDWLRLDMIFGCIPVFSMSLALGMSLWVTAQQIMWLGVAKPQVKQWIAL